VELEEELANEKLTTLAADVSTLVAEIVVWQLLSWILVNNGMNIRKSTVITRTTSLRKL
jgi:hypothetical protein